MKKLFIPIFFLVVLFTQSFAQCAMIPDSILIKDKSLIIVVRPGKPVGRACAFPIGVDNEIFCVLKNNEFGYINVDSGNHKINGSRFLEGSYELTMSQDKTLNTDFNSDHSDELIDKKVFEAGKIYYYKVLIGLGSISINARLEEVSKEEAEKILKKSKLTVKNKETKRE